MSELLVHQYFEANNSNSSCENVLNIVGKSIQSTQLFEYPIQETRNINKRFIHKRIKYHSVSMFLKLQIS
jgi:hypothetical protein